MSKKKEFRKRFMSDVNAALGKNASYSDTIKAQTRIIEHVKSAIIEKQRKKGVDKIEMPGIIFKNMKKIKSEEEELLDIIKQRNMLFNQWGSMNGYMSEK